MAGAHHPGDLPGLEGPANSVGCDSSDCTACQLLTTTQQLHIRSLMSPRTTKVRPLPHAT